MGKAVAISVNLHHVKQGSGFERDDFPESTVEGTLGAEDDQGNLSRNDEKSRGPPVEKEVTSDIQERPDIQKRQSNYR